jgi:ubiquinone/menaquinone biosynthesis C-methylase UbiE
MVVKYLDPQPGDRILDLGCGDGTLTAHIAEVISPNGEIIGIDASSSMISAAQEKYPATDDRHASFAVQDCSRFSSDANAKYLNGSWDKVFSNAALHWILRNSKTRRDTLKAAYDALKPGGTFVFEMGGHGNVAEVYGALIAALVAQGISPKDAYERSPWFFPSTDWMHAALLDVGFQVERVEIEYRPTKMTPKSADGKGGLEGWIRLMGAEFLEAVEEGKRDEAVKLVTSIVENVIMREEDGSQWLGYVRLRGVAKKV